MYYLGELARKPYTRQEVLGSNPAGCKKKFSVWDILSRKANPDSKTGTNGRFLVVLHSITQTLTTYAYSHPYEHTYAKPTPTSIFKDSAGKSSRLTKSPQAPRCRRERRLSLNAQCR